MVQCNTSQWMLEQIECNVMWCIEPSTQNVLCVLDRRRFMDNNPHHPYNVLTSSVCKSRCMLYIDFVYCVALKDATLPSFTFLFSFLSFFCFSFVPLITENNRFILSFPIDCVCALCNVHSRFACTSHTQIFPYRHTNSSISP